MSDADSSRTPSPIIPQINISHTAAANIAKATSTNDSSFQLYLDPLWSNEEYTRETPLDSWRSKRASSSQAPSFSIHQPVDEPEPSAFDVQKEVADLLEKRDQFQKEGEKLFARLRKTATTIQIDSDSPVGSLGAAYYDIEGGADNEANSDDSDYSEPDFADGDMDEVARVVNVEDYEYVPEASPTPYEATPQPELEGTIYIGGPAPEDIEPGSKVKPGQPRVRTVLKGEEKQRADDVLKKTTPEDRSIRTLLSLENLIECKFLKEGVGLSPEAGPSNAKKPSRKRKEQEASSSFIEIVNEDMSQKSGKLPPFMAKSKVKKVPPKPKAHAELQVDTTKTPLSEKDLADRDAQIIQDRIHGASGSKRQRTDDSTLHPPKNPTTPATMSQHLFGMLGSMFAGEKEPETWWKAPPEDNATAITRCLAEAFIRQASHTKAFNKLNASNKELDMKNKVLMFQKEEDKRSLEKTYKADLEAKEDELKKSTAEVEKLASELKVAKETQQKMEGDVAKLRALEEEVTKLRSDLKVAQAEVATAAEEGMAKGSVEFMKDFIRKIPDFDWERLGPGNTDFAATLRKEIEDEDAEEERLAAEAAKVNQDAPPPS
ncbi:hypothetical protein POM88_053193 [Heracleum sosnowskyi]|uniref:Uncharacterized protein n=1 Tax=Heracleum sosnowskyi TaxID=360622 RepID=A0AAD8LWN5_9APIA|nr:hypothetical protein POM88_054433 [Heracleum sosnowskyi]KAK1352762.1 hypothetical protein POM88_053193 [Heracleum sosnowskyi]